MAVDSFLLKAAGIHSGYGKLEILHGVSRNRFAGTGQTLLNDPEVKRLYLGG